MQKHDGLVGEGGKARVDARDGVRHSDGFGRVGLSRSGKGNLDQDCLEGWFNGGLWKRTGNEPCPGIRGVCLKNTQRL